MQFAVEVGQLEVGRLERREVGVARRRGLAEVPRAVLVVMHNRLTELTRECSEVKCAAAVANEFRLARRWIGTHTSPRHAPSDFSSHPLARVKSALLAKKVIALGLRAINRRDAGPYRSMSIAMLRSLQRHLPRHYYRMSRLAQDMKSFGNSPQARYQYRIATETFCQEFA